MVTLESAQNALKEVYLGVVSDQLNIKSNALLSKINQTSKDVYGREIIKLAPFGLNGGILASTETGKLPEASSHKFLKFKTDLKNLYGTIALSDKAIRASASNTGAFVNLLSDEMESLIKSSSFNLSRMLYGDGTGKMGTITEANEKVVTMDSVKNFVEGMVVDIYSEENSNILSNVVVEYVDRQNKKVTLSKTDPSVKASCTIYFGGSKDNEITGIKRLFDKSEENKILYGVDRTSYPFLYPYIKNDEQNDISDSLIQNALNSIEEECGSQIDFIAVSGDVRTLYQEYLSTQKRNIDIVNLEGGFRTMTYAGIPVVYERFVEDGTMYLLNTKDFNLHQLCDWEWLENENGSILIPSASTPTYSATLVKYAELICDRPGAQGMISNIK